VPGVLTQISVVVIGYGVLVALVSAYSIWRWQARPPWLVSLVWMLEFLLAVRALAGLAVFASGDEPRELATHLGYLAASVCVLPIAVGSFDNDDESTWAAAVIGVAAVGVTVISWRLVATL
jgi:hypothetical protein